MRRTLVVDAANVVGSKPDGWWRDRAGAATRLLDAMTRAGLAYDRVVLVLEGTAKRSALPGPHDGIVVVHAPRNGDDEIVAQARAAVDAGSQVDVTTSDRGLRERLIGVGATPSCVSDLRRRIGY